MIDTKARVKKRLLGRASVSDTNHPATKTAQPRSRYQRLPRPSAPNSTTMAKPARSRLGSPRTPMASVRSRNGAAISGVGLVTASSIATSRQAPPRRHPWSRSGDSSAKLPA